MRPHPSNPLLALFAASALLCVLYSPAVEPAPRHSQATTSAAGPSSEHSWLRAAYAQVYFASPEGAPSNPGTASLPLDLATALSAAGPLRPGDLLWLRGGTYLGNFRSDLEGTADAFIVVAQFPGERAVLDGAPGPDRTVLRVEGSRTVYWGFEVTSSATDEPGRPRGAGVDVFGPYTKFINLAIHHTGNGMGVWTPALEVEVYGTLIYQSGWDEEDRGHGHSIYIQNDALTKRVIDNILFDGRSFGVHAYTENGEINNLYFEGNISFNHGTRSKASGPKANFLVGGRRVAKRPVLVSNYAYYPWASPGRNADLGYIDGCSDAVVTGNYLAGGVPLVLTRCDRVTMNGNRFIGGIDSSIAARFPDNQFVAARPLTSQVFVRPNRYVQGRAHVAIFNWERRPRLRVDLSSVGLHAGDRFEIRDVRNYFGEPLSTGVYSEPSIELPVHRMLSGEADEDASGLPPEFGAAVIVPLRTARSTGFPWAPHGDTHR